MKHPTDRLVAWMHAEGINQAQLAERIGCKPAFASALVLGHKLPGRDLSHRIEDATSEWSLGPIRSRDWIGVLPLHKKPEAKKGRAA